MHMLPVWMIDFYAHVTCVNSRLLCLHVTWLCVCGKQVCLSSGRVSPE